MMYNVIITISCLLRGVKIIITRYLYHKINSKQILFLNYKQHTYIDVNDVFKTRE